MKLAVRPAGPLDARPMAELLNEIIAAGGTTALTSPLGTEDLRTWMTQTPERAAWHLAETEDGTVVGFQWIEPADYLPDEAAEIATFARLGSAGLGIGSALFRETEKAARKLGYAWINANIRADNSGGLAYYQSRGFEDYATKSGVPLGDGQTVDKVLKRYDLR
ncbi:GNAT family N-acetyltransferase [Mameliella sediminis]|uniref:GNAT family N-acetyltransferase n=1 Tax=Mameliella sediminis TaxID=2836866 RepID=UPI001C46DF83|nr:GNAT family N-acetyltransferase [Mameliella sediminis]MBV7395250.1 GNAT family N-acetyltransferase [Mameliella sediminis]